MKYHIKPLTEAYSYLWYEYESILDHLQIDIDDVLGVHFMYIPRDIPKNEHTRMAFYQEERFMYKTNIATSYCVMREELELPIYYEDYLFSYLLIELDKPTSDILEKQFIVARFGTMEVDYQLDDLYLFPWTCDLEHPYITLGELLKEDNVFHILKDYFVTLDNIL